MKIACALKEQLFTSVDGASLAFFRIGFCFLLYYDMVRYGPRLSYTYFSTTEFTFKYFGFEWVQPLPSALLIGLFVVLAILALCVMLGFYYRLSIGLFTLGYTYIFLLDQGYYLNHFYMVILFCLLLCVVPAHSCWSIDKRQNRIDTGGTVPAWSLLLLCLQLEIILIYAGIVKVNSDWLNLQPLKNTPGLVGMITSRINSFRY